jgi:hypothetical protein
MNANKVGRVICDSVSLNQLLRGGEESLFITLEDDRLWKLRRVTFRSL